MSGFIAFAAAQHELGRELARSIHMHTTDSAALLAIIGAEERGRPLTPVRLADLIGLTTGAASVLLNRLEHVGHIVRTRGHADQRMVTLHSTAAVHETADAVYQPLSDRFDAMMNDYSLDDLRLVDKFVAGLRATMDADLTERSERAQEPHRHSDTFSYGSFSELRTTWRRGAMTRDVTGATATRGPAGSR